MQQYHITHIVNCCSEIEPNHFPSDFTYLSLALRDGPTENIADFFLRVIDFIQTAKKAKGKTLVHCKKGISRSCTLAIAYIMWSHQVPFQNAFDMVNDRRGVCNPNSGFICQLLEFEACIMNLGAAKAMYCVERHSEHEATVVLKPCFIPSTRKWAPFSGDYLDSTKCFVVQILSKFFVWVGKNCADSEFAIQIAQDEIQLIKKRLMRDFSGSAEPIVYQDQEPAEFSKHFKHLMVKSVDTEVSNSTPTETPPQEAPAVAQKPKPKLYFYSDGQWEEAGDYDHGDLVSDVVALLLGPEKAFLWQGKSAESLEVHKETFSSQFKSTAEPNFEKEGEESKEFWQAFENGF